MLSDKEVTLNGYSIIACARKCGIDEAGLWRQSFDSSINFSRILRNGVPCVTWNVMAHIADCLVACEKFLRSRRCFIAGCTETCMFPKTKFHERCFEFKMREMRHSFPDFAFVKFEIFAYTIHHFYRFNFHFLTCTTSLLDGGGDDLKL